MQQRSFLELSLSCFQRLFQSSGLFLETKKQKFQKFLSTNIFCKGFSSANRVESKGDYKGSNLRDVKVERVESKEAKIE